MIDKVNPNISHHIMETADFINSFKHWDINPLVNILPRHIINKIKVISIPTTDILDQMKIYVSW